MTTDEKLEQIRNVFAYLGKDENGNYLDIDIETISLGYFTNQQLKDFPKELHCFRHGEKDMINQRENYSELQKNFMVDFGLTIINVVEKYINEKTIIK